MKSILSTAGDDRERRDLFEELQAELMAHAAAEEQTFYAELLADAREQVQQSVAGNDRVAELAFRLRDLDAEGPQWLAAFTDLKAAVENHLDLEEAELLPRARRLIKRSRAKRLGKCFEQVKLRELCLDNGCSLQRQTDATPGDLATAVLMNKRQQPGRVFSSKARSRGLLKRATSRGLPRTKGG